MQKIRKTSRRVLFQDRELGLKIYRNKREKIEILVEGKNLSSLGGETEFAKVNLQPNVFNPKGMSIKLSSGKLILFSIEKRRIISINGEIEIEKGFLFGNIVAASIEGEPIKNYELN